MQLMLLLLMQLMLLLLLLLLLLQLMAGTLNNLDMACRAESWCNEGGRAVVRVWGG